MAKADVFGFDAAAWLERPEVQALGLDEQGAVVRMLCFDWLNDGIEPRHLPGLLGLERERVKELIQGLVGELFEFRRSDGRIVGMDLEAQRLLKSEKSAKSAESARSRWKPKRTQSERTSEVSDRNATASRANGRKELEKGSEAWEGQNGTMPEALKDACEAYRKCRAEARWPMYKAVQWAENLKLERKLDGTHAVLTAADLCAALWKSIASGWRSVNPRPNMQKRNKNRMNRFAALEGRDARG